MVKSEVLNLFWQATHLTLLKKFHRF